MASPASSAALGPSAFRLGVERLFEDPDEFARLSGKRIGLITNPTGVDAQLRHTVDRLVAG
ncbi:hypothetical protein ATY41_01895 [Leifsonia xyli subsp. xyli]|uniref:DUF1343 domain-containing protein n=1 Tax=Leifsonia xyli subsp. xyli TaxID=59736 RepID=A0A1E2SKL2_LEIXY|nr:hypothetical protein [Leifsonia xyli]AAT88921.1 conserved hypothetical protein [Leifsonia xyli subsp. xyli str. CTCB07]ODA90405.1 hypothetical protein ATY41_01895 [Leifsonia xyli subsp. xyli]